MVWGAELCRANKARDKCMDILGAESTGTAELGRAWTQGPRQKGPLLSQLPGGQREQCCLEPEMTSHIGGRWNSQVG